ncbi:hypothetical protein LTR95_011955 [Oleoguttula sp. CCFEE 5521]
MKLQLSGGEPEDETLWHIRVMAATHEFGHAIGLVHEHQRPGYNNIINPTSPAVNFAIDRIPGYQEALRAVTAADGAVVPEFRGLSPAARLKVLYGILLWFYGVPWLSSHHGRFSNANLAGSYWQGKLTRSATNSERVC